MKKKGFTLIELLAVIVILAIIALIAVPTVLNIVERARKGAAKSSALSYIKAVETYIITSELDRDKLKLQKGTKYNVTANTIVGSKNYLAINSLVELKGSLPTGSKDYLTLDNSKNVNEGELTINGYVIIIKNGEIISVNKGEKIEIESMTLNHTSQIMEKGSSFKLEPIFTPIDASNQEVTYTSSDENIVTVDEEGNVTAKNIGNAKIIVTSEDNTSIKAECNIEVIVTATGVEVTPSESEIKIGETVQLTGKLIPSDTTSNALSWSSSDINIAVVNENGLVTGISKGEVTITATTVNGKTSSAKITVKEILAESITLNKTSATIENGNTVQLSATVSPSNTTNKSVTWSSSNTSVATVDSTGLVTAKAAGTATITASTSNGLKATSEITVVISPTGISLNKTSATIENGSTLQLTATVSPSNATNKSVTWTSSNTSVATVSSSGLVTAKATGSTTITSSTSNGKTATSTIAVVISPTGVSLNKTSATIENGSTLQLTATVSPSNATNKSVTWTSSNTSVATVSNSGLVTAKSTGSTTITAKTSNGKTVTASITVYTAYLLSDKVSVGDYVAYDAGKWTSTAAKPTSQGNFGGYTSGQNKANSVICNSNYVTTLKGWRVLSVSGTTVTLVHAGVSECYYHKDASGNADASVTALNNRATSVYLNKDYADNAHMMTFDEAKAITGYLQRTTNDLRYLGESGTTADSPWYWLATAYSSYYLYCVEYRGIINGYEVSNNFGVRPVIVLKEGIKTTGKGTDAVGQEAWTLVPDTSN